MRFMAILQAKKDSKASKDWEAGVFPDPELMKAMGDFNEQMARAGVLLAAEGLQPGSKGARVRFAGGKRTVIDGPFAETKELVAGFWILQVSSRQEAIEWIKRAPAPFGENEISEVEIRQVFEPTDFPADVFPAEEVAREQTLRDALQKKSSGR